LRKVEQRKVEDIREKLRKVEDIHENRATEKLRT